MTLSLSGRFPTFPFGGRLNSSIRGSQSFFVVAPPQGCRPRCVYGKVRLRNSPLTLVLRNTRSVLPRTPPPVHPSGHSPESDENLGESLRSTEGIEVRRPWVVVRRSTQVSTTSDRTRTSGRRRTSRVEIKGWEVVPPHGPKCLRKGSGFFDTGS